MPATRSLTFCSRPTSPSMPKPKQSKQPIPRRKWTDEMARFEGCIDCRFYKMFHTDKHCQGCTIGENFDEKVEELDPDALYFLSRKS